MIPVGLPVCIVTMLFGFLESKAFILLKAVLRVCSFLFRDEMEMVILILTPLDRQLLNCPTLAEALTTEVGIYATQALLTVSKRYLSGNPFTYSMTVGLMRLYSTEKIIITP